MSRTRFAVEYQSAPKNRFGPQAVIVDPTAEVEITALCPSQAECGGGIGSHYFDAYLGFIGSVDGVPVDDNLFLSLVAKDDAGNDAVLYSYLGDEENDGIRSRGFFARNVDSGFLQAPDGTLNRLFVRNDSDSELAPLLTFEIPWLDWRGTPTPVPSAPLGAVERPTRKRFAPEFEAAPRSRRIGEAQTVDVPAGGTVEITDLIPRWGTGVLRAPSVDLIVSYAPTDPNLPVIVVVGPLGATGAYFPVPGTLITNGGGTGHRTMVPVRKLRPRATAAGSATPALLDGNRVFLVNLDDQNETAVTVGVEVPLLDWT